MELWCYIHASICMRFPYSSGKQLEIAKEKRCITFQLLKATGSTTVGWIISRPGNTPQVTAVGSVSGPFVNSSPCKQKKNHD